MTDTTDEPPGFQWPRWMAKLPEVVVGALFGLSGLLSAFIGFAQSWKQILLIGLTIAGYLAAVLISCARHKAASFLEQQREALRIDQEDWIDRAEREHAEVLRTLLGEELHNLIHVVAEAVATEDPGARRNSAGSARQSIVCAAANMVGRNATSGTRANLFRLSGEIGDRQMTLEPNRHFGRGDISHRVFEESNPDDKTFRSTIKNKLRFMPSVTDDPDIDEDLPYDTFLTHPVSVGRERIHGALTVDCLEAGQLTEEDDGPMMAVLSTLIAITYECEKYPSPRRTVNRSTTLRDRSQESSESEEA